MVNKKHYQIYVKNVSIIFDKSTLNMYKKSDLKLYNIIK